MTSGFQKRGRPLKSEGQKAVIREKIIASARTLFLEDGFENVSMRKIAAGAGCTPTTLYHYFHNKRHMLHFLWQELFQQVSAFCMASTSDTADPLSKIRRIMTRYMAYWFENPDHFRIIFMVEDLSSPPREDINAGEIMGRMTAFQDLMQAIRQGVRQGQFRYSDGELIWQILFAHSHGIVSSLITIREIQWRSSQDLIDQSVDITLKGLSSHCP